MNCCSGPTFKIELNPNLKHHLNRDRVCLWLCGVRKQAALQTDQHHSLITSQCFTDWKIRLGLETNPFSTLVQDQWWSILCVLLMEQSSIKARGFIAKQQRNSIYQSKTNKRSNLKVYQAIKRPRRATQLHFVYQMFEHSHEIQSLDAQGMLKWFPQPDYFLLLLSIGTKIWFTSQTRLISICAPWCQQITI